MTDLRRPISTDTTKATAPRRRGLSLLLRLGVTATILAVVLWHIDTGQLLRNFQSVSLACLAGAIGLRVIARLLTVLKWKICLDASGIRLGFWQVVRIISLSGLIGMALPSGLGADAVRLVYLRRMRQALTRSAGTILADRLVGVLVMAGASTIGTLLLWEHLREGSMGLILLIGSALVWTATTIILSRPLMLRLRRLAMATLTRLMTPQARAVRFVDRVLDTADRVHRSLHELMHSPLVLSKLVVLDVLMLAVRVAIIDLLFRGLGAPMPFGYELAFVPMIFLLSLLPISLFGLGVGEGAFIYFFRSAGVAPATALAVSLLNQAVNVAVMVLAGVPFFFVGHKTPAEASPRADAPLPSLPTSPTHSSAP